VTIITPTGMVGPDGLPINMEAVRLADRLIKAKRENNSEKDSTRSFWRVIDEVINVWKETRPNEWRATIIEISEDRDATYNEYGAAKKEKTQGTGDLRRTIDVPEFVEKAVRFLYSTNELPFNKEWYQELWKRYPEFRVSQKL
jgi:hypothetical protein